MDSASYRERLYDVFANPEADPDAKIRSALGLGADYLQLPIGFVTQIHNDTQEIVYATGEHPLIQPGETCPLDEAYCRRTFQIDSALAIQDSHVSDEISEKAVEAFDLGTYIGAKITVGDEPYGTVCFADTEQRGSAFTEAETYFVELFAELIGQAIERHTREHELEESRAQLRKRNQLIGVLNRVLRHNLRNEMSVIVGFAMELQKRLDGREADFADRIVRSSTELLDLAETAQTLEATLNAPAEPQEEDVVPYVVRVARELDNEYPAVSVHVRTPEAAYARSDARLETALRELVENAVIHQPSPRTVELGVTETEEAVTIRVEDDGPGIPQQERQVLLTGEETPLEHGSGLGLWLVHWIVQSLDGTIRVDEAVAGACVEIRLRK
ncbi:GAF domain-containing protein [Haloplanus vescus]|uniref:GAF domain-containing protein n=1 Tax=Haloplanus vescus TaxID=555874 RepID=A0A1H3YE61_9EURY|nr:GAF domain-containing sensor histidine kinase [Haloplanus vescus]SEA09836.1 GAF domain-containing protein [Haloplanus vescus]